MSTVRDLIIKLYDTRRLDQNGSMVININNIKFVFKTTIVSGILRLKISASSFDDKTTPSKIFNTLDLESNVIEYMTDVANNIGRPKVKISQRIVTDILLDE